MSTERKLEEIAATLDDVTLELDEIAADTRSSDVQPIERARSKVQKAADAVEDSLLGDSAADE